LSGAPLRAVVRNTSVSRSMAYINVLEEDAFAGEASWNFCIGERRLLSYAADKAVRIVRESQLAQERRHA